MTLVAFVLAYIFTMPPVERPKTANEAPAETGVEEAGSASPRTSGRTIVPKEPESNPPQEAIIPQPGEAGPLERVEPRAPLSDLAQPPLRSLPEQEAVAIDDKEEFRLLPRPVAVAAGIVEVSGFSIVLEGIDVVSADETCTSPDGKSWPCGMQARTAFRSWLRSRSLNCRVPKQVTEEVVMTDCQLAGQDVSEWLVSNGWARAKAESAYADMQKAAEEAHRGIFGSPAAPLASSGRLEPPRFDPGIYDPLPGAAPMEPAPQDMTREAPDVSLPFPPAPLPD